MKAGDLVLFNGLVPHGSPTNNSDKCVPQTFLLSDDFKSVISCRETPREFMMLIGITTLTDGQMVVVAEKGALCSYIGYVNTHRKSCPSQQTYSQS
jgi:hypothetical protein